MYQLPRIEACGTGLHPSLPIRRLPIVLRSDDRRVIIRPFVVDDARARRIISTVARLSADETSQALEWLNHTYAHRHQSLSTVCIEHYEEAARTIGWDAALSVEKRALAGGYLSMEYSIESAALFNPSICLHPDQQDIAAGAVRFVMSLRATGEGHVSSIVFRTGTINSDDTVDIDPLPSRLHRARMVPDRTYLLPIFTRKLIEMGAHDASVESLLRTLPDRFSLGELRQAIARHPLDDYTPAFRSVLWLAESNYHVDLSRSARLDELAIYPMGRGESNGMEDLRLTRFVDDDGSTLYCGTYTAYNGIRSMSMLLTTEAFKHLEFHSLNGRCALNKGMALFPRRINGDLMMCGRIDGERLFLMRSRAMHFWDNATPLAEPKYLWEMMLIGNCGPPVETPRGWILLTHGVGPMRTYSMGAMVLDREDPSKIIGRLREPLLTPSESGREGYVPNIVYTCGSLLHGDDLFIPFALADKTTSLAVVNTDSLIDQAMKDHADSAGNGH
jgi:predicted GH43/DUF377 family glycosyl hydrolase